MVRADELIQRLENHLGWVLLKNFHNCLYQLFELHEFVSNEFSVRGFAVSGQILFELGDKVANLHLKVFEASNLVEEDL